MGARTDDRPGGTRETSQNLAPRRPDRQYTVTEDIFPAPAVTPTPDRPRAPAMPKVCPVCGTTYSDANVFCPADGSTLRAAESAGDLIGTVIADRYLVTDLLGAGGMGTVYLARHVRLPQQAAIKVLKPEFVRDPGSVARFNREAANASRIDHERIARVFDYGETSDGTVYLAMEYVPGRTLKQILIADGAQPLARTAELTKQVAEALDAAHRLGIVHRDLKPDNIMVIEDAELGDRCKVVDFGIAKAMGGDAGEPGLTKTGFIVGTPEFMSPEQLLGGDIDHRSDVYALALVAYRCLTGALPFDTSTPERTMTARLTETPQPLATVRPDVRWPAGLQSVFDQGLARDREARYASASAFARAFAQAMSAGDVVAASALAGASASARATATVPKADVPAARPQRSGLPVAAIAGAVLVGVAVVAALFLRDDREPATASGSPAGGSPATQVVEAPAPSPTLPQADSVGDDPAPDAPTPAIAPSSAARTPSATTQPAAPPTRGTADPERAPTRAIGTSAAALFTLDSLRIALDPATATAGDARRAIAALRGLLPRLRTAEDSAWAYLREAEAHFLTGDARSACLTLEAARPLARTAGQRDMVALMSGSC
jgi:serine/threonine-protein kinase